MNFHTSNVSPLVAEKHGLKLLATANRALEICDMLNSGGYKLIINEYGNLLITRDPTTTLECLRLSHPIQILLKEGLAGIPDTDFLISIFSRLLRGCRDLFTRGMKLWYLVDGLREAGYFIERVAFECAEDETDYTGIVDDICGKKLASLVEQALSIVGINKGDESEYLFSDTLEDQIRVCKIASGTINDSYVISGMVFEHPPEGRCRSVKNARTAIFNCPIDIIRTETKGTVLFDKAEQMLNFNDQEEECIRSTIRSIDAQVIVCNGSVGDLHREFLDEAGKLVYRIPSKHDIRRLRNCIGGSISPEFKRLDEKAMGHIESVETFEEGGKTYTNFVSESKTATIILKDTIHASLDDKERVINRVVKTLKGLKRKFKVVRNFSEKIAEKIGSFQPETALLPVFRVFAESFREINKKNDEGKERSIVLLEERVSAVLRAIEMVNNILMIEDYLVAKEEGIKPRENREFC